MVFEIETTKVETIKITGISKADFEVQDVYDGMENVIGKSIAFKEGSKLKDSLSGDQETIFMEGMIDLIVKKFPRNGKLKVKI